jgi:hypothetical protein
MADKVNPSVSIEIGGKERKLLFCFRAMVAFEEATGKNLFEQKVIDKIIGHISPSDLRALLWAELLDEDRSVKLDEVTGWITLENKELCAAKVLEAWIAAMPEKGDKKEESPLTVKPPTS